MDPGHALHVRVTRSPEHYQPLCMPDANTLTCRHAYTCVHVYLRMSAPTCMCVCVCVRVHTCRAADFTCTYVNTYGRYIGIGYIPGGVPFERRQWAFRYDTVDRTARIFGIGALSLGKISVHRRMPEKYFDTVYRCLRALMHVCTDAHREACLR